MKSTESNSRIFLIGNVLMGVNVPFAKFVLGAVPLGPFLILRHLVAGVLLALIAKKSGEWRRLNRHELRSVAILGLISITLTNALFYYGMTLVPSTHVLLVGLTMPVTVYILSWLILKESFQRQALIGTIVSVSGVVLLIVGQLWNSYDTSDMMTGIGILLLATLTSAYAVVRAKRVLADIEPVQVAALQLIIGALPFTLFFGHQLIGFDWMTVDWQHMAAFFLVIAVFTPLSYAAFYRGLKAIHVRSSVGYLYFQMIAGDIVALAVFSEQISVLYAVCIAIVMTGVWLGRAPFGKAWAERRQWTLWAKMRLLGRVAFHRHGDQYHIFKNDIDIAS